MQERTLWIGRTAARLLMSAEGGVADVCHVAAATVPKLALAEQAMLWIVQPETSEAPLRSAPHRTAPHARTCDNPVQRSTAVHRDTGEASLLCRTRPLSTRGRTHGSQAQELRAAACCSVRHAVRSPESSRCARALLLHTAVGLAVAAG